VPTNNRPRLPALIAALGIAGGVATMATAFAPGRPAPTAAAAAKVTAGAAPRSASDGRGWPWCGNRSRAAPTSTTPHRSYRAGMSGRPGAW
jgi:hypothetical protein